jgi:hypothetical protein
LAEGAVIVALVLSLPTLASAAPALLCVNPGGTDGCYASIQAAVDGAVGLGKGGVNATIEVHPGTYLERVTPAPGTRLTIRGVGGPDDQLIDGSTSVVPAPAVFNVGICQNCAPIALTLQNLSITNRGTGPGVQVNRGSVTMKGCRVFSNQIGLYLLFKTTVSISDSEITDNQTPDVHIGAGIDVGSQSRVTIKTSTIANNSGNGLRVGNSRVSLENSTVSGNTADIGAGAYVDYSSNFTARFSTIAHNSATSEGGGLFLVNLGGSGGKRRGALLQGTILAGNIAPMGADCLTVVSPKRLTDNGFNLIESTTDCPFLARPTTLVGVDPQLQPLGHNGGPTQTQALGAGSPARAEAFSCPKTDQRGVLRSRPCSIGAVE